MAALIRAGEARDLPALVEIYNHYVVETSITFDIDPVTLEQRRAWLEGFGASGGQRLLVAESEGRIAGWAESHAFRAKAAYDTSVETSVYLAPELTGRGLGSRLYGALFEALAGQDLHRALAGITVENPASIALHRRFGFRSIGVFTQVGRKFGKYWDVEWLEKEL